MGKTPGEIIQNASGHLIGHDEDAVRVLSFVWAFIDSGWSDEACFNIVQGLLSMLSAEHDKFLRTVEKIDAVLDSASTRAYARTGLLTNTRTKRKLLAHNSVGRRLTSEPANSGKSDEETSIAFNAVKIYVDDSLPDNEFKTLAIFDDAR